MQLVNKNIIKFQNIFNLQIFEDHDIGIILYIILYIPTKRNKYSECIFSINEPPHPYK